MKIRVKEKDFVMFIIFSIFLLYLCCVAVLNFASFRDTGTFYGLNPFPAFTGAHFKYTIIVFIGAWVAICSGVSGFIFSKEKGKLGLVFGEKDEKGYSRWATDKELKNAKDIHKVLCQQPTADFAGVALMNNGKEMYVDSGENHTLVIGATASGKTTSVVDPLVNSLSKRGESMVITDPKGEIYKQHCAMLKAKGYNVIVLNFRDPSKGSSWNPLSLPYKLYKEGNRDKAIELLDDVARNIFIDPNNKADPFWEKSAVDYFAGMALGLFEDADENEVNINTISYMATVGEEKIGTNTYIKEYFSLKGEESTCYTFASNTINAPSDTKGSILSIFRQKIRIFATKEDLSEMLSVTDFDIRKIGNERTAIFLVIHDEKTTYHALATIFIKQVYETLIDVAYKEPSGKLSHRTNFILDEFANMPPLKDVTSMVTAARSRDIRFTFIIQNFAQLNQVYGKEDAETIKSNCGNMIYLITTELAALEEISKLCGEVKSKDKEKTASLPLITVADLQKMKLNEVIIRRIRSNPFKTKLTPSYKIDWGEKYEKSEFYDRDKNKIKLFDLKDFVTEKKRNKLRESSMNSGNNNDANEKAFGRMGANPFGMMGMGGMNSSMMGGNPFMNDDMIMPQTKGKGVLNDFGSGSGMNLDDLVKKIDAQLAELEKEEAGEKSSMDNEPKPFIDNRKKEDGSLNPKLPNNNPNTLPEIDIFPAAEPAKREPIITAPTVVESLDSQNNISSEVKISSPEIVIPISNNNSKEFVSDEKHDFNTTENSNIKINIAVPEATTKVNVQPVVSSAPIINQVVENSTPPTNVNVQPAVSSVPITNEVIEHPTPPTIVNKPVESISPVSQNDEKTKVNVDVDSIIVNNNVVTEDDFFDDFFADE